MSNDLNISIEVRRRLHDIVDADGASFVQLVAISGLNPAEDFIGADLQGIDFGECDLTGYDFSGADLREARLDRASLDGAIFTGARSDGAIWPRVPSRDRKVEPSLRFFEKYELREFQQAIVNAAMDAFDRGVSRPIVAMPPGTGRSTVLRNLLAALDERGDLQQALIFAGTQAELGQLHHSLASAFGSDAVAPIRRPSSPSRALLSNRLIVENVSSLRPDRSSSVHPIAATKDGISHIVILDGGNLRHRLNMLQRLYPGVPILTFVSEIGGHVSHKLFGEGTLIFALSYRDAIEAGALRSAEIFRRLDIGERGVDGQRDYWRICSDIADTIQSMPHKYSGAVVCKDIQNVQIIASQLRENLSRGDRDGHQNFRRIVEHTSASADYSLINAAVEMPGTVIVMTASTYNRFDWGAVDFAFVVTMLKRPELAAFPRSNLNHAPMIFDYVGSFKSLNYYELE